MSEYHSDSPAKLLKGSRTHVLAALLLVFSLGTLGKQEDQSEDFHFPHSRPMARGEVAQAPNGSLQYLPSLTPDHEAWPEQTSSAQSCRCHDGVESCRALCWDLWL
ncbi:hypothetical protein AOLI_G00030660 [Acnodon oligacanthus]